MSDDPEEIDLDDGDRRRRPARSFVRKAKAPRVQRPKKPVKDYHSPAYHNRVGIDPASELPTGFVPTPKPKKKGVPQIPCPGVPDKPACTAMIGNGGNRKRCPACSDLMTIYRRTHRKQEEKA